MCKILEGNRTCNDLTVTLSDMTMHLHVHRFNKYINIVNNTISNSDKNTNVVPVSHYHILKLTKI